MAKKNAAVMEQGKISKREFIAAMRRLTAYPEFGLLRRFQTFTTRERILRDGRLKPSAEAWAKLEGYELAMMEAQTWAAQEENDPKAKADELEETLREDRA